MTEEIDLFLEKGMEGAYSKGCNGREGFSADYADCGILFLHI